MPDDSLVLRFIGSCRNDGTKLSPENVIYMLEKVTNCEFELLTVHRRKLIFNYWLSKVIKLSVQITNFLATDL